MSSLAVPLTGLLFDDTYTGALDPFALFAEWLAVARETEPNDPNAMAVASVDEDGFPDQRMVLLNGMDERGFIFFTNFESAKGRQLQAHRKAAALFHWKSQRRQIRLRGPVEIVEDAVADAYFASRPLQSRIGAHASDQSRPLDGRQTLVDRVDALTAQFGEGPVERPARWSGFRIVPQQMEFWKDGEFRLHDRVRFSRENGDWSRTRLYP